MLRLFSFYTYCISVAYVSNFLKIYQNIAATLGIPNWL